MRLAALLIFAACWRNPPEPAPVTAPVVEKRSDARQPAEVDPFDQMEIFADQMCNCRDSACAHEVADRMTKWAQEQAKNVSAPPKLDEADQKRAATIGERMGQCMQKAMMGSPPP